MSSEDEAVAWLRAQVEGDKALAERVAARYIAGPESDRAGERIWPTAAVERAWEQYEDPDVRAGLDFVKANDPRDKIARCESDLALLDVHAPVSCDGPMCEVCAVWEDDTDPGSARWPVRWPCMTLEIVAAGYRHRPGYAEHWDARACPGCGKPDVVLPLGHDLAIPMDGSAPFCEVSKAPAQ
jgi:hypothetical protein